MAIRPVDMQVMLPKLAKMKQVKPNVVNKEANAQQIASVSYQKESEKKMKRVTTFETKAEPKVKNEEKKHSQEQNKKKKKDEEENEKKDNNKKIRHIDMKI